MSTEAQKAITLITWRAGIALVLLIMSCTFNGIHVDLNEIHDTLTDHEHNRIHIQQSIATAEPVIEMGSASEGFPGDGLVGIEPVFCWVTHYGPPNFGPDRNTSRCITIRACLLLVAHYAQEWDIEIDGFCAVSPGLPWYGNHRDPVPTLLYVEGYGNYLVLDRKGWADCVGVDIYEPDQAGKYLYCEENIRVWEVDIDEIRTN